ncbi:hypothetical protein DEO48_09545 [Enterobacter sp. CGMCC 5087]|nr:hypothetical protein DEO48_09545 [Enterobacter sp. CGMCC 5087]
MINIETVILCLYEAIVLFMIIRVMWVHRKRQKVLRCMGLFFYNRLPGHNEMLFKFWVWDINKFIK